ncbi:MAG: hypothetical protein ACE5KA_06985 [Nitrososphaerales archaeon]
MIGNASLVPVAILVLAITLTLSSNLSFAQDEYDPENLEHEAEKTLAAQEEHEETEEHSSHEDEEAKHETKGELEHEHIRETVEGPHVHSSATAEAALWVGLGTLLVAAPIFGISIRSTNKLAYKNIVLTLAVGVGIMHLLLTPDHLADVGMGHGIFFAAAGIAQIGFGILFMVRATRNLALIGATGNIGSIILYFITRIENLPELFTAPEGIDPIGIIAKITEMSLVALLIYLVLFLRKGKAVEIAKSTTKLS